MMSPAKFVKQTLNLQKSTFENTYNATVMVQEHAQKMVDSMLDKTPWVPEEGRKFLQQWVSACKKGQEEFKKTLDENYKKAESLFDTVG